MGRGLRVQGGGGVTAVPIDPMAGDVAAASRQRFLDGMSRAACTVNVVTTDGPAGQFGVTVSAMTSISADTPKPTLLVCIHDRSVATKGLIENGVFCVNVLRDDQAAIADCFAGRIKPPRGDRFACADWVRDATGSPRLVDGLAGFSCRVAAVQRIGEHHMILGHVESVFVAQAGAPLIYAGRCYGTPVPIPMTPPFPASARGRHAA